MKKRILYSLLLVAAAAFSFSSCLDENPKDQMPEDEAYKDPTMIYLNTVANLYTQIGSADGGSGLAGTDRGLYDLITFTTDEAVIPKRGGDWDDGGLWINLFKHNWGVTNDLIKNPWNYLYKVIGMTNQSLDKLNSLIEADPSNIYLPKYKAEVQALRAMYYYYLLDMYARVPIVESSSVTIADVKQSSRSEVFAFVKKELEEALPYLSTARSANPGEYYGRVTRPVAFYLLAKLALNAQVYADDDWLDNGGMPDGSTDFSINGKNMTCWEATVAYCDSITDLGYELEPKFSTNFSLTNENSKENIFVIPMDPTLYKSRFMYLVRTRHYEQGKAYDQDGWNGSSATKEALAVFRKDGGDPRLPLTFYMSTVTGPTGQLIMNGNVPLEYKPDAIAVDVSGTPDEKTAGARWAKYETDPTALAGGQLVHNDYVLYRYADVLLMRSEALVRQGKDGTPDLMTVRNRVGATARVATLDNILDERLLELAWEGVRRQDLVRYGKFNIAITDRPATGPYVNVFPIDTSVLNLNTNLTQNPGYTN